MIHTGKWVLVSHDGNGFTFWEKLLESEKQARQLFHDLCRHAAVHGGSYRLKSPDGGVETFSASAESE